MTLLALGIIVGEGLLLWALLESKRSFGAYAESQREAAEASRQQTLVVNESMLLLHQYHLETIKELRRLEAAYLKGAA